MSDNLAVAADGVSRLEVVILFGHFLGGTDKDGFYPSVSELVERAERIGLCGLLPLLIGGLIGILTARLRESHCGYQHQNHCGSDCAEFHFILLTVQI